jgi:hypothetical protein
MFLSALIIVQIVPKCTNLTVLQISTNADLFLHRPAGRFVYGATHTTKLNSLF